MDLFHKTHFHFNFNSVSSASFSCIIIFSFNTVVPGVSLRIICHSLKIIYPWIISFHYYNFRMAFSKLNPICIPSPKSISFELLLPMRYLFPYATVCKAWIVKAIFLWNCAFCINLNIWHARIRIIAKGSMFVSYNHTF